jgi:hypothetical protein
MYFVPPSMAALVTFLENKYFLRRQFMRKTVVFGLLAFLLAFSLIGCDNNGDDTEDKFVSSIETISNNETTLGLIGTAVSSSNTNVATVETPPTTNIKITSISQGTAVITVSAGLNIAKINVTVSKTGSISKTIEKYEPSGEQAPAQLPINWKNFGADAWDSWISAFWGGNGDPDDLIVCLIYLRENLEELSVEGRSYMAMWCGIWEIPFILSDDVLTINMWGRGHGEGIYIPTDPACDKYKLQDGLNKGTFPVGKWINIDDAREYILFTQTEVKIKRMDLEEEETATYTITNDMVIVTWEIVDWYDRLGLDQN